MVSVVGEADAQEKSHQASKAEARLQAAQEEFQRVSNDLQLLSAQLCDSGKAMKEYLKIVFEVVCTEITQKFECSHTELEEAWRNTAKKHNIPPGEIQQLCRVVAERWSLSPLEIEDRWEKVWTHLQDQQMSDEALKQSSG